MTVKEFILAQEKNLGINDWIALIKEKGLEKYETLIIQAADSLNLIVINDDEAKGNVKPHFTRSFIKAIKGKKQNDNRI